MTDSVLIPPTIDTARERLASIEGLLTAKGWERAAVVYAFTRNDGPGGDVRNMAGNPAMSIRDFAKLRIAGLGDRDTIAHYRAAWQTAIDQGKAKEPIPGQKVTLPKLPFPPNPTAGRNLTDDRRAKLDAEAERRGVGKSKVRDVASNPRAVGVAIEADEPTAAVAREAIVKRDLSNARRRAERSGVVLHAAEHHAELAAASLRRAAQEKERNGALTDDQTARLTRWLDESEHLLRVLRGQDSFTPADRDWLDSVGVN